jgi:rfaE bifunctional protein kinase chain/domain
MMARAQSAEVPSVARLLELLHGFPGRKIAVLGDLVADEFVSGEISRVSREAPVLILRRRQSEFRPGGGANAVNNLAHLGARVLPVGFIGDDPAGNALLECFRREGVNCSGIIRLRGYTTPTKTRFLAGWLHTTAQQVLRVDSEPSEPLPPAARKKLEVRARRQTSRADALLISDYGYGAVTPALARKIRARIVTLDSRYAMLSFRGARISAATPNEPEMEALYHASVGSQVRILEGLARRALRDMRIPALLVTRGKDGMVLFERGRPPLVIPPFGEAEAVDVTGAGDTVIAVFTLGLAAGGNFREAALLANYAGGIAVMKRGTATVTLRELEDAVRQNSGSGR